MRPVRCHLLPSEAAPVMMLRFQWDSLRRGDHILVHDVRTADLGLRPAVVELVDSSGPDATSPPATPTDPTPAGSFAPAASRSHPDPVTGAADCWRCAEASAA